MGSRASMPRAASLFLRAFLEKKLIDPSSSVSENQKPTIVSTKIIAAWVLACVKKRAYVSTAAYADQVTHRAGL